MGYNPAFQGKNSLGSARSLSTGYQNGETYSLTQGQPVCINTSGQMVHVDVTSDSSVAAILGVSATLTPSAANGQVVANGRLENITTSFNVGDPIYINTDGTLMNTRPDIGVQYGSAATFASGDYVVFVGVIVLNEFNTSNKDLVVFMDVVGQL